MKSILEIDLLLLKTILNLSKIISNEIGFAEWCGVSVVVVTTEELLEIYKKETKRKIRKVKKIRFNQKRMLIFVRKKK